MKTSCISHPPREPLIIIRKWQLVLAVLLAMLVSTEAQAQQKCSGQLLTPGTSCEEVTKVLPPACPPPEECAAFFGKGDAGLVDLIKCGFSGFGGGISPCLCEALGGMKITADGKFCIPEKPDCEGNATVKALSQFDPHCRKFPIKPKQAFDPNDKVGTLGVSDQKFIGGGVPLNYAVHFENLATATAPAQVVLVTDQLDAQRMDLGTFQFGPMTFGDVTLLPQRGAQTFTGGVDLRPARNLIVTIKAGLDKANGLVTWLFTSIDPDTGQLTEDPDAGFLPPNTTPPAGEGSVVFTVMPKGGLPTGTQITNQARVVFDVNAPIDTPTWLNTIDNSKPRSAVSPLAPTQPSTSFPIQWSGTDTGSGINDFTIFVSDNGGPFNPFISDTTSTSATFSGQNGHTYAFYSVATDLAGNTENSKAVADTVTTVILSQPPTAGDINGDGKVDCGDLAIIKASFGKRCGQIGFDSRADTNKDCVIDVRDLAFVSQKLPGGTRCP